MVAETAARRVCQLARRLAATNRVLRRQRTGVAAKHRPGLTGSSQIEENSHSGEEQGGGCFGPIRRSRGEAVGDYVFGEEPFHTAAVDRTVAGP